MIYSSVSSRLNVSSRGLEKIEIIKEIILEMLQLTDSSINSRFANRFTDNDRKKLNPIIDQIYEEYRVTSLTRNWS